MATTGKSNCRGGGKRSRLSVVLVFVWTTAAYPAFAQISSSVDMAQSTRPRLPIPTPHKRGRSDQVLLPHRSGIFAGPDCALRISRTNSWRVAPFDLAG